MTTVFNVVSAATADLPIAATARTARVNARIAAFFMAMDLLCSTRGSG
jgi:hypothetical protein